MTKPPFLRLEGTAPLPDAFRGSAVVIGNFDGVHRGHQEVIRQALGEADRLGRPLVVLTFEPHPRTFFAPDRPVPRLTPAPLKARLFEALGVSAVVERPFTADLASCRAEDFVRETLVDQLGAGRVVVGFDFRFGAHRSGDAAFLRESGRAAGFAVDVVESFDDEAGRTVSSSRVREALVQGEAEAAATLLGYRWLFAGTVGHGAKLGRTLGYPTANTTLPFPELLAHGIYAVRLRRADGSLHDGVASYGRRPTFDDGAPLFETFLFDFKGNLYGEEVEVCLFSRLRGEERFASAEALVEQMHRDAAQARLVLEAAVPLGPLDQRTNFR